MGNPDRSEVRSPRQRRVRRGLLAASLALSGLAIGALPAQAAGSITLTNSFRSAVTENQSLLGFDISTDVNAVVVVAGVVDTSGVTMSYRWLTGPAHAGATCSINPRPSLSADTLNFWVECNDNGTFELTATLNDGGQITSASSTYESQDYPSRVIFTSAKEGYTNGEQLTIGYQVVDISPFDTEAVCTQVSVKKVAGEPLITLPCSGRSGSFVFPYTSPSSAKPDVYTFFGTSTDGETATVPGGLPLRLFVTSATPDPLTVTLTTDDQVDENPGARLLRSFFNAKAIPTGGVTPWTNLKWSYTWLSGPAHPGALCDFPLFGGQSSLPTSFVVVNCDDDGVIDLTVTVTNGAETVSATKRINIIDALAEVLNSTPKKDYLTGEVVVANYLVYDPGKLDGTTCVSIDWGDGTPLTPCSGTRGTVSHIYAPQPGGQPVRYFTVTGTSSDGGGRVVIGPGPGNITVTDAVAATDPLTVTMTTGGTVSESPFARATGPFSVAAFTTTGGRTAVTTKAWSYQWVSGPTHAGATCDLLSGSSLNDIVVNCSDDGVIDLTVTVSNDGETASATRRVTITDEPAEVFLTVPKTDYVSGETVSATYRVFDPGKLDGTTCVSIDWGDGTPPSPCSGTSGTVSHTYAPQPAGAPVQSYFVNGLSSDGAGIVLEGRYRTNVTVTNAIPTPNPLKVTLTADSTVSESPLARSNQPFSNARVSSVGGATPTTALQWSYQWVSGPTHPGATCDFPAGLPMSTPDNVVVNCGDDGVIDLTVVATNGTETATATQRVIITDTPAEVLISTPKQDYQSGEAVVATYAVVDPGVLDGTTCVSIDWGDATPPSPCSGTSGTVSHAYASRAGEQPAAYAITGLSSDGAGRVPSGQSHVTVTNTVVVLTPGAPTITRVTRDDSTMVIRFNAPTDIGNSPITSYTAVCTNAANGEQIQATGKRSPIKVRHLRRRASYTCTVAATNASGTGPESAPSTPFRPRDRH